MQKSPVKETIFCKRDLCFWYIYIYIYISPSLLRESTCTQVFFNYFLFFSFYFSYSVAGISFEGRAFRSSVILHLYLNTAHNLHAFFTQSTCIPLLRESTCTQVFALVSFAEYRLFYRALLQKRPMFLGSLLIVATP